SVLPTPRLSVNKVRLAGLPGADASDMAQLKSLSVRIKFAPLLRGRVEVESITLVDPVIRLEALEDGRVNWDFAPPEAAKPAIGYRGTQRRKRPEASPPAAATDLDSIRLDSVRIVNGTLTYRDAASGTEQRIDRIEAELSARSLAGPFRVKGSFRTGGVPLALDAAVGRISEEAPTSVNLRLGFAVAEARADITGTIARIATAPRMSGRMKLVGNDFAAFLGAFGGAAQKPPWLQQKFSLEARLRASAKEAQVSELRAELGDVIATGTASAAFGERISSTTRLKINRVDLDRWLAIKPAPPVKDAGGQDAATGAASKAPAEFSLPRNINASIDVSVESVKYLNGQVRDIRLAAALNEGEITLSQASARLPGGADASLFGFLAARDGKPHFDGSLEARADNLRGVLRWLGIDLSSVPADRLRKFSMKAKLKGDGGQVHLLEAKIGLDTSRIQGGVTVVLQDRLSFGASINLNHLNLDAYLPAQRTIPATDSAAKPATPATPAAAASGAPDAPLAALNDFDANLRLRVGSLIYRRTAAQGISFDGTLAGGKLTLRGAGVRNIAGTRVGIKGVLGNFDKFPIFKGTFEADSRNLTGLARITGMALPVAPKKLGVMKLRGRADSDADKVRLRTTLELAGAVAKLSGDVEGLRRTPRFSGKLNITHPELAKLLRAFGQDPGKGVRRLGAFGFATSVNGDLAKLSLDARMTVAGSDISLAGAVSGLSSAPRFDLDFKARHPSYLALMKAFDPAYRPAGRKFGPVSIAAKIKGDGAKLNLGDLSAKLGAVEISGDGALELDGARPRLRATLSAGEIVIDPFLARDAPAPAKPRKNAGRRAPDGRAAAPVRQAARFSVKPFDMSSLAAMDADIALSARALTYRQFRIDRPVIKALLTDRVLTISKLAGRMFDGAFDLTGTLDAKGRPALDGRVKVDKANIGKALFEAGQFDIMGGVMDFDMAVKMSGNNERAMIAGLSGQGSMAVRNGVVQGFDLRAVSDRMKNIDRGLDIFKLFGAAMGGGTTRFSALDGTFRIDKGVLRSNDIRIVADAGEGRAKGVADLPRWTMDFLSEFRLTEHPKTPPFAMIVRGPIDNPRRILKMEKLQSYLLQRGIGGILRRAFPNQSRPPASAPQPAQPRQTRPEDILRGLLDGLR
ncbi:MAG: AsmA family protein, partial [Alphaproteobacteria bacterium]